MKKANLEASSPRAEPPPQIETLMPLVTAIAVRMKEGLPANVDLDDLVSEGTLGALDALGRFDPEKNVALVAYAKWRIRGAILDYLRHEDYVSRDMRRWLKNEEEALRLLASQKNYDPDNGQIAEALGTSETNYAAKKASKARYALYVQQFAAIQDEDESTEHNKQIDPPDSSRRGALEDLLAGERRTYYEALIAYLPERERIVLQLYLEHNYTMLEIGTLLNVNESRISQMFLQAVRRLEKVADPYYLTA